MSAANAKNATNGFAAKPPHGYRSRHNDPHNVLGRVYEAQTQDGRYLGWEFPFRLKNEDSINFVTHLIRYCVVVVFGGVKDTRWPPDHPNHMITRKNLMPHFLIDLCARVISDAHALSYA